MTLPQYGSHPRTDTDARQDTGFTTMGLKSKRKGERYEREVASKLREYGYATRRTAQYSGKTGQAPDVVGLPYIHIECKHYANRGFDYDWLSQAKRDARDGEIPIVVHRIDNAPSVVTLELDRFIEIYREYEASRYLSE